MRVAVTGGGGFVGSHVVDHLVRAGHDVLALDINPRWRNPAATYAEADIFDVPALEAALTGRDAVFHLAAATDVNQIATDPVSAVRLNVEGTARVLDAARLRGCGRVLLASSVWVYGAMEGAGELTEDLPVDLRKAGHIYISTKLSAELLIHSYRQMYGLRYTILRYGIPYGPRMRPELVVAKFVAAARRGEPITISGTGEQQRNYVYVEDLADAHVRSLSAVAEDQTLALEGGTGISVREIAEVVQRLVGDVPLRTGPARTADYAGLTVSNRLAKELLGWSPVTSFEAGVRRYLDWLATDDASGTRPTGQAAG